MTIRISVLMSTYNEDLAEIQEAIDSILKQSFHDFELIIVDDDPEREDLRIFLEEIQKKDSRIRILVNETNMGLARSMNRAAACARGAYLARMDADDISCEERLAIQYACMQEKNADFSCTSCFFISDQGQALDKKAKKLTSEEMVRRLEFCNPVAHPTVMMRRAFFEEVGGYRDFPCTQDYDLWLRFLDHKAVMIYIDEKLLYYRIRSGSTSQRNRIKQGETRLYMQALYRERKRNGKDTFSKENYEKWLKKHHVYEESYIKKEEKIRYLKDQIDERSGVPGKERERAFGLLYLCLRSPYYRRIYFNQIKGRIKRSFVKA